MQIVENYKHFIIYEEEGHIYFKHASFISSCPKSVLSAKNLITRYINKTSKKEEILN